MLPGEPGGRRFETPEASSIGAAFELQYQRCAPPPPCCAASAALRWRPLVYVRELSRGLPSDAKCCQPNPLIVAIAIPSPCAISDRIHLLSRGTGVMDVIAVATAKGKHMNTLTTEENGSAQVVG